MKLKGLQPLTHEWWVREHLPVGPLGGERYAVSAGPASGGDGCGASGADTEGSRGPPLSLSVPCTLRLAPRAGGGGLDLQLELFALELGEHAASGGAAAGRRGPLHAINRGAALLLARLLFPDTARPVCRVLLGLWAASAAASSAARVARWGRREAQVGRTMGQPAAGGTWRSAAWQGGPRAGGQ